MIVVTGANGQLGRAIVEHLLGRLAAAEVGVSVRDPSKAEDLGVRVRRGDYDDPASLEHAFEGAGQVLIVSAATTGEAALRQHRTAIEAARNAGVERIVYTSHMGVGAGSRFAPMRDHAATEAALEASGVPFTSLRNGFYASSGVMLLGQALETGELLAPEDGPVSWTTHADLAEAAAIILTDGGFDGPTPPLTAAHALDLQQIAELSGKDITRIVVSDDEYRQGLIGHGVPEPQAEMLVGLFEASRAGEFAVVDPTLTRLLGRSPAPVRVG